MKQKEILLLGATDQIGRNLIRKLTNNNYKIIAVTRNIHRAGYILKTQANPGYLELVELKNFNTDKLDELMKNVFDELNTSEKGDLITLGSPQLGLDEISDLSAKLKGRSFEKRCMVFMPRTVKEQAQKIGYISELERAGCEILSDCCTCLTPLICKDDVDAVTTNSIKGAFYLKNSNGVGINLKSLKQIVEDETR